MALVSVFCSVFSVVAALDAEHLGVIFDLNSAASVAAARSYVDARQIPPQNIVGVRLPHHTASLSQAEFAPLEQQVTAAMPATIEAYAVVWTQPFRVACMSLTSAFAFGFDNRFCAKGCRPTATNPYFGSNSKVPFTQHGIRPTMLLSGGDRETTEALIRRGVNADASHPQSKAYLITTTDKARNSRSPRFAAAADLFAGKLTVKTKLPPLVDRLMFYFTGAKTVANINNFEFLNGAIADHLTSFGGVLNGNKQMTALAWIQAGATGSYGTVVEPCNFPQKFPDPVVLMAHYLNGDTLIESYWKSVQWPGQGLFVGEPLARPFATPLFDTSKR